MSKYLTHSLDNYVKFMNQRRYSKNTIIQYCSYINNLSKIDSRIYRLTNSQIQEYIVNSISESTQNCKINAIKLFFKINHPERKFKAFIRPQKSRKIIEILTVEEIWGIINNITHIKQKAIISGIYLHGLRISEILNLQYNNINRKEGILLIRQSKGRKDRVVPLNKRWLKYLKAYSIQQNHRKGYNNPIFQPYSKSSVSNILKNKASILNINKRVYPHLLRDSYATHLLQQGVDIKYIQEILGHFKITTTEKYIHLSTKDVANIELLIPQLYEI